MIINSKVKKFVIFTLVIVITAGAAGYSGYYLGAAKGKVLLPPPTPEESLPNADFSLFGEAIKVVKEKFFNADEINDQKLLYGAIRGAINALGDPYSVFFEPSDAKKFEQDIEGSFGGIGAEIGIRNNQLVIVAPLKGNPAEKVGLKAGDKIIKINDVDTFGLSVEEAVKLIRGEEGSEVILLILRDGWERAKEFKITRATITVPTLDWEIKEGDILYIHLQSFNSNAPPLLYEALVNGLLRGADGLILDLRNNPGGFLEVSIRTAGWFLERGSVVVSEKFADGRVKDFRASGNGSLKDFPMVVIINEGSASASEILAGALRDHRGIKLVGEKTFGKGTVQELENLRDGSVIKISMAEWVTPNGSVIEKKGLKPDLEVKMTEDDVKNGRDPQLEKAIEVLKSELVK